jgi:adenine-specific DNA-methyltransferase
VGFGRPGFKKHWRDLRSYTNPVSSWIARLNEEVDEESATTLRSREAGEGTGVLEKIFGKKVFNYPKPPSLLKQLVSQTTDSDSLILDFFAGSGTTAQAVLEQNAEDEGTRRFILVSSTEATQAEPSTNICSDVCAVRVGAVIKGFGGKQPTGGEFAYLRAQRIRPDLLLEIEHEQVWTALQLAHLDSIFPWEKTPFLWAGDEESAICYVPRFRRELLSALRRKVKESASVVIYSWQPQALQQHIRDGHVTHLPVSETLTRRFGLNLTLSPA